MIEDLTRLVESMRGSNEYHSRDFEKVVDTLDLMVKHIKNLEDRICDMECGNKEL